jgi:hypothetical protein
MAWLELSFFSVFIWIPNLLDGVTQFKVGLVPQLLSLMSLNSGNSFTHPEVCYTIILGISQSNQVDNQN